MSDADSDLPLAFLPALYARGYATAEWHVHRGRTEVIRDIPANLIITIREGDGIVDTRAFSR